MNFSQPFFIIVFDFFEIAGLIISINAPIPLLFVAIELRCDSSTEGIDDLVNPSRGKSRSNMSRVALGQPSFKSRLVFNAFKQGIVLQDVIENITINIRIFKSAIHVGEKPPPFTTRFVGLPHFAVMAPASIISE